MGSMCVSPSRGIVLAVSDARPSVTCVTPPGPGGVSSPRRTRPRRRSGRPIAEAVLRFVPDPVRVAVYESLPDEPPTGRLVEALLAAGHEVIVPVVLDDFSLEWRYAVPGTSGDHATVRRPSHGGHAPDADERDGWLGTDALATCDLVVTPGLVGRPHTARGSARAAAATTAPCSTATPPRPSSRCCTRASRATSTCPPTRTTCRSTAT